MNTEKLRELLRELRKSAFSGSAFSPFDAGSRSMALNTANSLAAIIAEEEAREPVCIGELDVVGKAVAFPYWDDEKIESLPNGMYQLIARSFKQPPSAGGEG